MFLLLYLYHTIKQARKTMKLTKQQSALIAAMKAGKLENQNQQNLMFKILNGSNEDLKAEIKAIFNDSDFEGFLLDADQVQKGYAWLLNQWQTPTGAERKNNPFGYREQNAINNFDRITLKGYYDAGNYYRSYFIPLYDVYTIEGYGFEYYVSGGQCNIIG